MTKRLTTLQKLDNKIERVAARREHNRHGYSGGVLPDLVALANHLREKKGEAPQRKAGQA